MILSPEGIELTTPTVSYSLLTSCESLYWWSSIEKRTQVSLMRAERCTCHCSSLKKSGQELKQGKNLEAGAGAAAMEECCLQTCSSCFLIEPRTAKGWHHLLHWSSNKKMHCMPAYSQILLIHFLSWWSLLSDDDNLWQADIKLSDNKPPFSIKGGVCWWW